jgi:hypothetical protein
MYNNEKTLEKSTEKVLLTTLNEETNHNITETFETKTTRPDFF